ncbi:fluoride efflux transporter CrcB [Candidatus Dependentiae bacterium]
MKQLLYLLSISIGGAIGALSRYAMSLLIPRETLSSFPWSTFVVNVSGAFFAGLLLAFSIKFEIPTHVKLFVLVGLLGAFTSFSTFALENVLLITSGKAYLALANILASNIFAIVAFYLGFLLTRIFASCR